MNGDKVEMIFITSNKLGILSSIIMVGNKLGLIACRNQAGIIDEYSSRLFVTFNGILNCSDKELINEMESLPEIYSVENLSSSYINSAINTARRTKSYNHAPLSKLAKLHAADIITAEALKVAEEQLIPTLGSIAPLFIQSAKEKTKHIGDLYLLLSEELESEERNNFLSLVSGLKLDRLT